MNNSFYIVIVLLLISQTIFGQSISLEWFRQEDGLPNDLVKAIKVDSSGFLWIATDDGMTKMEGRNFNQVNNPQMFSNNYKNILFTHQYGIIATADPGLLRINQDFNGITADYFYNSRNVASKTKLFYPKSLYQAGDSSVWLADLQRVFKIETETLKAYDFPKKNSTDHFSRSFQFFEIKSAFYALSQLGYLYKFDKLKNEFIEIAWKYSGNQVYSVLKIAENKCFVGCDIGLVLMEFNENNELQETKNLNFSHPVSCIVPKNIHTFIIGTWGFGAFEMGFNNSEVVIKPISGIEKNTINDIAIDNQGQTWFATNQGLCLLREKVFSTPFEQLTRSYIQDIIQDFNGINYFADGKTVYRVDKGLKTSAFFNDSRGMVLVLCPDAEGMWMGTNTGYIIYKTFTGKVLEFNFSDIGSGIYNLCIDKENKIWFIQNSNEVQKLYRIDKKGNLQDFTPEYGPGEKIRSLRLSPEGELYVGADGVERYLFKYNYTTGKLDCISTSINTLQNEPLAVNDIAFSDSETIYLATKLGTYIYKQGQLEHVNLGDMSNEMVSAIAIDTNKSIYLANSNGIIKYKAGSYSVYDNIDGLPAKTTHYRCLNIDSENNLWVGTISGVGISNTNFEFRKTPKPIIYKLEKSGQVISIHDKSRFLNNSLLNLYFATPIYPSKHVRYQYALVHFNREPVWKDILSYKDNLIISDLKQGDYTLFVRAKYRGNFTWSDSLTYTFSIYKPWYLRPLHIMIIYLLIFLLAYIFIIYRNRKSQKEKQKLELIILERTQNLQYQNEELKQLNISLKLAKEESEAAIKSKDRFFSILAHDLKSPFNALIGFSQLLVHNRDEISEEAMVELFGEMLKVSENTFKLLENLLDWARSQTGSLKIEYRDLIVDDLLADILPIIEITAHQKNISIKTQIEPQLTIWADTAILATIFRNLVSNAIKFSNSNTEILITGYEQNGLAVIKIIDQGIGIPANKLEQLFSIEEKVSTKGTLNEMGTGLGLVLCHDFVQKVNGNISVTSIVGQGTTFTLHLPLNEIL